MERLFRWTNNLFGPSRNSSKGGFFKPPFSFSNAARAEQRVKCNRGLPASVLALLMNPIKARATPLQIVAKPTALYDPATVATVFKAAESIAMCWRLQLVLVSSSFSIWIAKEAKTSKGL